MTTKEFLPQLPVRNFHSSVDEVSQRGFNNIALGSSKFEFKKMSQIKDEKKLPIWEFHECREELVTFSKRGQKHYLLATKNLSSCVSFPYKIEF
jgi:hypothetical protein